MIELHKRSTLDPMRARQKLSVKRLGSALVMTLVIIVLITVVTVGYLASVMLETKTATSVLDQEKAYGFAMVGVHQAVAKVREALGPWDDPYKNFATNVPPFYWSISPGRITRWQYSSLASSNVGSLLGVEHNKSCQSQPPTERWIASDHRRFQRAGRLRQMGEFTGQSFSGLCFQQSHRWPLCVLGR